MPFTATDFQDSPSTATPITAAELDKLGTQYAQALADVPTASTSAQGKVELATSAETITGSDTARAVTPAGLTAKLADTSVAEIIRDVIGSTLVAGSNVTVTVDDALDTITIAATGGGGGFSFADPNADRIGFWDDSAGAFVALAHSLPLTITGTTLSIATATESAVGVQEFATAAETVTGSSSALSVHPAGLLATRGLYVGINAQTGTTYAPVLTDQGKLVTCSNASPITVTLPQNSTTAFPIGTQIDFVVIGAGMVTFAPGTGATVNGTPSLVTRAQYSAVTLIKVSTNGWIAVGDLA